MKLLTNNGVLAEVKVSFRYSPSMNQKRKWMAMKTQNRANGMTMAQLTALTVRTNMKQTRMLRTARRTAAYRVHGRRISNRPLTPRELMAAWCTSSPHPPTPNHHNSSLVQILYPGTCSFPFFNFPSFSNIHHLPCLFKFAGANCYCNITQHCPRKSQLSSYLPLLCFHHHCPVRLLHYPTQGDNPPTRPVCMLKTLRF